MEIHFLFYFFQICLRFDGYLFIIIITTYTIGTAIARSAIFVTTIDSINKNIFELCQKWVIFDVFLIYFFEYLVHFNVVYGY